MSVVFADADFGCVILYLKWRTRTYLPHSVFIKSGRCTQKFTFLNRFLFLSFIYFFTLEYLLSGNLSGSSHSGDLGMGDRQGNLDVSDV